MEHGLLMENLLDLAHAPFTHTSTFAKGWPVPDLVKFRAAQLLSGNWEPYPIDMVFQPPCMVLSTIGLAQPGKIQRVRHSRQGPAPRGICTSFCVFPPPPLSYSGGCTPSIWAAAVVL